MRSTWLKPSILNPLIGLKVKIVFITGRSNDAELQQRIEYESEMYGDILQADFIDTYEHNTYKAMSYLL